MYTTSYIYIVSTFMTRRFHVTKVTRCADKFGYEGFLPAALRPHTMSRMIITCAALLGIALFLSWPVVEELFVELFDQEPQSRR
jgi:hypothetical protein